MFKFIFFFSLIRLSVAYCPVEINPCQNIKTLCGIGRCIPSRDCRDFTCDCPSNSIGPNCSPKQSKCTTFWNRFLNQPSDYCQNEGVCHEMLGGVYCRCPAGFKGERCQIKDEKALAGIGMDTVESEVYDECQKQDDFLGLSIFGDFEEISKNPHDVIIEFEEKFHMRLDRVKLNFFEILEGNKRGKTLVRSELNEKDKAAISVNTTGLYIIYNIYCCNYSTCLSMEGILEYFKEFETIFYAEETENPIKKPMKESKIWDDLNEHLYIVIGTIGMVMLVIVAVVTKLVRGCYKERNLTKMVAKYVLMAKEMEREEDLVCGGYTDKIVYGVYKI